MCCATVADVLFGQLQYFSPSSVLGVDNGTLSVNGFDHSVFVQQLSGEACALSAPPLI